MTYSFKEANDFLRNEAQTTPEQMCEEIWGAWCLLSDMENKRNRKMAESVRETLLTCADYFQHLAGKEVSL